MFSDQNNLLAPFIRVQTPDGIEEKEGWKIEEWIWNILFKNEGLQKDLSSLTLKHTQFHTQLEYSYFPTNTIKASAISRWIDKGLVLINM